jgi:hypothetical protein
LIDPIKGIEIENIAVFQSERVVEATKPEDSTSLFNITGENRIPTVDLQTGAVTHAELAHDENSSLGQIGTLDETPTGPDCSSDLSGTMKNAEAPLLTRFAFTIRFPGMFWR